MADLHGTGVLSRSDPSVTLIAADGRLIGSVPDGDPGNKSSIVSQYITAQSNIRQCDYLFPLPDGSPGDYSPTSSAIAFDTNYKGWNLSSPNTFFVNGQFDPWRSASLSSSWNPNTAAKTSANVTVIPGARHCWDQSLINGHVNPDVMNVQTQGIARIRGWLEEWYQSHPSSNGTVNGLPTVAAQVGLVGGKPLTDLLDMGTPSTDPPPATSESADSVSGASTQLDGNPSPLTTISLTLNVVLLSLSAFLIYALLKVRRRHLLDSRLKGLQLGDDRYTPTRRKRISSFGHHRDSLSLDLGDQSVEYGGGPLAKGRGVYSKVGDWTDD